MKNALIAVVLSLFVLSCNFSRKVANVSYVGTPHDEQLALWAQDNLLPRMTNPYITWDGKITVADLGYWHGMSGLDISLDPFGNPTLIKIFEVTIDDSLNIEQERLALLKEVLAHYAFHNWYLENPDYVDVTNPDFLTLVDGMGYNYLAGLGYMDGTSEPWDGTEDPTCGHLRAVDSLFRQGRTAGTGVGGLLELKCTSPIQ